ncbi:P-type ATPase [Heterostelium album PN500]|uniref:Cation-transporting ATPase n=1 Tax=Heterostelium pallidum (strain ATCC 26659 / Pp 5 / PN500) TaxID=670386 RepID=D3BVG6_HETP5|nr:P-type ATPase [Heterostelium album PN500]EFA74589.1 P-type ATPase [Heterostelium album PN500]|eukprot:XP_020426723.1 P-type ATPase [Heterostelium album PN500]
MQIESFSTSLELYNKLKLIGEKINKTESFYCELPDMITANPNRNESTTYIANEDDGLEGTSYSISHDHINNNNNDNEEDDDDISTPILLSTHNSPHFQSDDDESDEDAAKHYRADSLLTHGKQRQQDHQQQDQPPLQQQAYNSTPPTTSSSFTKISASPVLIANRDFLVSHEMVLDSEITHRTNGESSPPLSPPMHSHRLSTPATPIRSLSGISSTSDDANNDELLGIHSMTGYKFALGREILFWILTILTGGLLLLFFHWFTLYELNFRRRKTSLENANYILVYGIDMRFEICQVKEFKSELKLDKVITFRHSRFFYNHESDSFIRPRIKSKYNSSNLYQFIEHGLTNDKYQSLLHKFGYNVIEFPIKSIPRLLLEEVLHPFFIFQIYSVILWSFEEYYYYAGAILLIATVSSILSLKEIRSNLISLKEMSTYVCEIKVLREGQFTTVQSSDLVPGDIIDIPTNLTLPCDMSLLTGQVICNESMLTGESVPVTKHPILTRDQLTASQRPNYPVDITEARSSLFGGTMVVKIMPHHNGRTLAMVRETGFQTSKGKLILSILFPKKSHFRFIQESFKFIGVLCCIAMIGFAISVWRLKDLGVDTKTIVLRALDLITIVIPPALPIAMTVGTGFALIRLKKVKIFCISPPRLNMAGKLQVFCFDKTGTLTEEGLDFYGVVATNQHDSHCDFNQLYTSLDDMDNRLVMLSMASCHSLSHINNEIAGDPLEIKIFQATNSKLEEHDDHHTHIVWGNDRLIYQERFDFQSSLQRMSVIVSDTSDNRQYSFVKGSPEMIKKLSLSHTIPSDYDQQLFIYTERGYRVLACAYRTWDSQQNVANRELMRQTAEENLVFLGFIIMENKMKPESKPIIEVLHRANIKTIMVTGDNPLTAISVSKQCGIIKENTLLFIPELDNNKDSLDSFTWRNLSDPSTDQALSYYQLDPYTLTLDNSDEPNSSIPYSLVVTGPFFKRIHHHYLQTGSNKFMTMLKRGLVYARMSPDDKQTLIEELQRIGLYVGMCGDGANDCGALKSAHVGISLSETEASIAAPFTSTTTNITCCPTLIKEGRASLAVSFKLFQFMGMYSLIQFISVIFLYFIASVLGNWMYLYQDLWIIFPLVIFMGMTCPSDKLSIKRPSGRLISGAVVGSLLVHILVCLLFQTIVFFTVRKQPWYNEEVIDEDNIVTYVTTSMFIYANFQYLIMALSFSFGKPFLKPLYTNKLLFLAYSISLTTSLLLVFAPTSKIWEIGQLRLVPLRWRFTLIGIVVANLAANLLVEFSFVYYKLRSKKKKQFHYDQIFSKDAPKDERISKEENIVLLPISNLKQNHRNN